MNYIANIIINTPAYECTHERVELNPENWLRVIAMLERQNPTMTSMVITIVKTA